MKETEQSSLITKDIPVYRHSAEYAIQHGELEAYRESVNANMACRKAIEKAIGDNYRNNRLDTKTTSVQLGQKFGMERVSYVLANTIRFKNHDGRISNENKKWASTIFVAEDKSEWGDNRNLSLIVDGTHPGLVDLLANQVRIEMTQEKKPSVLEKLKKAALVEAQTPRLGKAIRREEER